MTEAFRPKLPASLTEPDRVVPEGEPPRPSPAADVDTKDDTGARRADLGPQRDGGECDLPPIVDPYLIPPPSPKPRTELSRLALTSLLAPLLLGPFGAILGIVFGLEARRESDRYSARHTSHTVATLGVALSVVLTMLWGGVLCYVNIASRSRVELAELMGAPPPSPKPAAAHSATPAPAADPSVAVPDPQVSAPKATQVRRTGRISVVDVGASTSSLADELAKQRAEASLARETVLVMTTSANCDPCRGVDRALADPRMQTALAGVRLVRIDLLVFHEDLDALKIPNQRYPGFFLLALDLSPRDGIDGGEWNEDVAGNIAPVLGAFVRGTYTNRREAFQPVPGTGMQL